MLIIIRNEERLSIKTTFITQILRLNSNTNIFSVFRKESEKFAEIWFSDKVKLSYSIMGLFLYFFLIVLKSPKALRNGLMARLSILERKKTLIDHGFLSILSSVLCLFFGTSTRADNLMHILNQSHSKNTFLIDEFLSLNCIDLKKLKLLGPIIYVSQDIAYNRFGFADNLVTKKLMFKLERDAIINFDLVIACSEMERLKYIEMGAKKAIFYPNIYPTLDFEPCNKEEIPSLCIVLRKHWGLRAEQSLEQIFNALACLNRKIKVNMIGIKPLKIPKNIILEHHSFIKNKLDYLKVLSKSWIGINVGLHMSGTNERKYDYAEAGTIVFSDKLGSRGDFLPHEYTYVDYHDLAAKLGQLLDFDQTSFTEMGEKNRKHILLVADKERQKLWDNINSLISNVSN